MSWGISDLERRFANMVKLATISATDHELRKIRVEAGGMKSAWLPWPAEVGRNFVHWRPLRSGQQVVLVSPSGDLTQAVVVGMLYSSAIGAPSTDENLDMVRFEDGTIVQYDSGSSKLSVECVGDVLVKSPSSVTVDAPQTTVKGMLTVEGLLTYQAGMSGQGGGGTAAAIQGNVTVTGGEVSADGIGLKGHTHTGDSGGSTSSAR